MIPKLQEYKKKWEISSEDSIKLGLEAIQGALVKLGNPEKKLKIIHVAGTNGKGSTIAFMEAILTKHGFTTGVFSSPAINDIHDQIRINGKLISRDELDQSFKKIKDSGLSGLLTDFELLTTAAFITFERLSPEYVLLETGMGGSLDSTNVVQPIVSVITSIALDHTAFLGTTIEEIAEQKAGIIKENVPVVIGDIPREALQVIQNAATKKQCPTSVYGEEFWMENAPNERFEGTQIFKIKGRMMKGKHQGINAALAIESLLIAGIKLKENRVSEAFVTTQLPHRFQKISHNLFLDGAHNPSAAEALVETIQSEFPDEKVNFVIGMLKSKDIKKTLDALSPIASSFTFLTFSHPDAALGIEMMEKCEHSRKSVTNVINDTIILSIDENRKTIVTGSLYLLSSLTYKINDLS